MPVDFLDAADRHWEDAELLFSNVRLANADQLFGIAAECALKAAMEAISGTSLNRRYFKHINELWSEFNTFAAGRNGSDYIKLLGNAQDPYSDWDISDRYNNRNDFPVTKVSPHQQAAQNSINMLKTVLNDRGIS